MKLKLKYHKRDPHFPNQSSVTLSYGKGKGKAYQTIYLQPDEKINGYDLALSLSTFLGGAIWKETH